MFLLTLLSYRVNEKLRGASNMLFLSAFGFQEGGKADITITDMNVESTFAIGICNSREYSNFTSNSGTVRCIDLDSACEYSGIVSSDNRRLSFNTTINRKNFYKTIFLQCDDTYAKDFNIEIVYTNPKSRMSYDRIPCLVEKPIFVVIFAIAVIFWYVNWIMNCGGSNSLHIFFTTAISFLAYVSL